MTSKSPYITSNALIRYCVAKAPERHRIIEEFRSSDFPPFKGWYGGETEGAVRRYIASGGADDAALADLEVLLQKRPVDSNFEEARLIKQFEALQGARETPLKQIVTAGTVSLLEDKLGPFMVEGVRVSVRPTNVVTANRSGYKLPFIGVVKPYFSSTDPLTAETADLYGALLHWYAEVQFADVTQADPALCFVLDVFQRRAFRAPRAYKQRRDLIAFSCREIYERWTAPAAARSARGIKAR